MEFRFVSQMSDGATLSGDIQKWTALEAWLLRQSLNPTSFKQVILANYLLFGCMKQPS